VGAEDWQKKVVLFGGIDPPSTGGGTGEANETLTETSPNPEVGFTETPDPAIILVTV
jgi:hypothetical protein